MLTVSTHAHVARGAPGARPESLVRSLTLGKRWKEPERGEKGRPADSRTPKMAGRHLEGKERKSVDQKEPE